jgi:UDP-2,3-diacylglucosamine hydrolase
MRLWVFSDLHITNSNASLFSSLLKVLAEPQGPTDHVVFAGDIFDLLVGDSSHFRRKYSAFFSAIETLNSRAVSVHYIEGNHDFHLSKLLEPFQVHLHEERVVLETDTPAGHRKILIEHGDLVDTADEKYLRLRKLFRSPFVKTMVEVVPGKWVEKLGDRLSRPLHQKAHDIPDHWVPAKRDQLRSVFRTHAEKMHRQGFDYIVLGHCHDLDGIAPFYWNMGYPPVHRQFLFYDSSADEMKRLIFP